MAPTPNTPNQGQGVLSVADVAILANGKDGIKVRVVMNIISGLSLGLAVLRRLRRDLNDFIRTMG